MKASAGRSAAKPIDLLTQALKGAAVTRREVADYARGLLAAARALPDRALLRRRFRVADLVVEARFSDPELAELYPARIACTPVADDVAADSRVDVLSCDRLCWPPPARWADQTCPRQDFETALRDVGLYAAFPYHPGLWQVFAPADSYGVQLCRSHEALPPWDSGAPLRLHLFWALGLRDRRLVHAGTLGLDGIGVLLVGPGGAGKSGTTLAGMAAGLASVGDDYVVLEPDPPAAHAIFRIAKLDQAGLARLGDAARHLATAPLNWQGKVEFDPATLPGMTRTDRLELRAILMPKIANHARTSMTRLGTSEAMRTLTFGNMFQIPAEPAATFRFLGRLTRALPAYQLQLAADPADVGQAIRNFIQGLRTT
jgi:hypothetical protein